MSEIIRDAATIAGEINAIKQEVRDTAIRGTIEIGKRLIEAKSLVPYGQWGKWLEENVDYSERTAQDAMRIAMEYGKRETQALAEIQNTTQAVLLLALSSAERDRFVQEHDMKTISTRELEDEIKQLKAEKEKQQLTIEELMGQLEMVPAQQEEKPDRTAELEQQLVEVQRQLVETEKRRMNELHAEQEKTKKASAEASKLRTDLAEAKRQTEAKEKQLLRTEEELEEARKAVQTVEVVPEAVEKELEALRKKAASSGAEIEMRAAFDGLKAAFERLMDKLEEAEETDGDTALKYRGAFHRAMLTMAERVK